MPPIDYYTMIKSKDKGFVFGVRLQMVRHALEEGIKPAARAYGVCKNTVKKWLSRYREGGTTGMAERSRAPHHIPHKKGKDIEEEVLRHRKSKPGWGAKRLKKDFGIPCSHGAISRILRENGMIRSRKRKKKVRRSLRDIKDKFRAFERNCLDTKHLYDIPSYWPQMRVLDLPMYQYTFRDVRSGAMFLGYSDELSLNNSTLFIELIGSWLQRHGVKTEGTIWQSDGGSEFIGSWQMKGKSAFIKGIESFGADHFQIPKITYNADVETVHNIVELEFYDIEAFDHRSDFFNKATTYSLYYNLLRKNSNRKDRSPLDILKESGEDINPAVLTLPALNLDKLLPWKVNPVRKAELSNGVNKITQGGHDVPGMS